MTTDAVGGVWQYSLDLASGLTRNGTETVLAVLGPAPTAAQLRDAKATPGVEAVSTDLPLDWLACSPREVKDAGHSIANLANRHGVDLAHLNSPALGADPRFDVPVIVAAHSCVKTWWKAVRGFDLPRDFMWRSALVEAGLRAADAIIAPTYAFAGALIEAYDLPRAPVIIHNGRSAVRPLGSKAQPTPPCVFTAGRIWDDGKNIAVLDRAAEYSSVQVFAAGPLRGPNGAAATLDHIVALGSLDDAGIAGWLAAKPIFVSTALYEPFGLAVLEAAQAGCPLILSEIPTFRELWEGAAEFVDPHDAENLAMSINRLAADAGRRERLGQAALERSRQYSVAAMSQSVSELHGSVLTNAVTPRMAVA